MNSELTAVNEKRSIVRKADNPILDKALKLWFLQEWSEGIPISGDMIREKAIILHEKIEETKEEKTKFTASAGFLFRFQQRHGIKQLSVQGEILSADSSSISHFLKEFQNILIKETTLKNKFLIAMKLA